MASPTYIGRFAPSPSGPLHFGSLIAALASFLDARHHHGQWLVRVEDIDPPREETGATQAILESLQIHGLEWDEEILYQSDRLNTYQKILETIQEDTYACSCSRPRLLELNGVYDSRCLQQKPDPNIQITSTRLRLDRLNPKELNLAENYTDIFQKEQSQSLRNEVGDFILKRKDGLFAYQLAVAIDDIHQKITHVIRGSDLLSSTPRQRYLIQLINKHLNQETRLPLYGHIPVAANSLGQKLSKQHKASPINDQTPFDNLCAALEFLRHSPPESVMQKKQIPYLLGWAMEYWDRSKIPQTLSFTVDDQQ